MKLRELLHAIPVLDLWGDHDIEISSLTFDSRRAEEGSLFIAVRGERANGHDFIEDVIQKGSVAIIVDEMPENRTKGITYVCVHDTAYALGVAAANYYDNPSRKLKLVGITGTNGKTTTATLLYQLFNKLDYSAGLISTIENRVGTEVYPAKYTTPDPIVLNSLLREMVEEGCDYCFMEVSSHAVVQQRIAGLQFA